MAYLLILAAICGSAAMINTRQSFFLFPVAGLCSGICSGLSVFFQPLGLIVPGIFFGIAIAYSITTSITRLSVGRCIALVVLSMGGYFAAILAALLSRRLLGLGNGIIDGLLTGAFAGGVGAAVVATSLVVMIPSVSTLQCVLMVPFAGACFGAAFMFCGIYINDHTAFGHPFINIILFSLWQAGVALVIPYCDDRS